MFRSCSRATGVDSPWRKGKTNCAFSFFACFSYRGQKIVSASMRPHNVDARKPNWLVAARLPANLCGGRKTTFPGRSL